MFDHLAARSLPVSELAKLTGTHQRALHRCLRGLAHFDLFAKEENSIFSLTDVSRHLTLESEFSLIPWHQFCQSAQSAKHQKKRAIWEQLLRTGKSIYQLGRGHLFYDYLREHQALAAAFDKGMESMSQVEVRDILQGFNFSASEHLTEIAGGNGALISGVLRRHDNMEGQLFDFPDVVNRIKPIPRLNTVSVDMQASLPEIPGDAMMKRILHSYCDEQAHKILRNVGQAMRSGNKLYIFELIEDNAINNPYIGIKNLQMLLVHGAPGESGGPGERTQAEFASLLSTAGFELVETQRLPSIDAVVAVRKQA
ncbi:O-methyltransferase, family 2 domain protein [Candidatus Thiomargarita nelsonii]|uniref:O-methyltransferase, family 2 domain protein n=1 Tax=Candidatus Thiomargarita nelsonii TaxID=1003181 RepID=A0A0A6NZN3_9GAMM|nr:O-methyltransferase, family 2 domain protein [Candidatus Thiomargarita nelsonii]